jgi:hypothetical protein
MNLSTYFERVLSYGFLLSLPFSLEHNLNQNTTDKLPFIRAPYFYEEDPTYQRTCPESFSSSDFVSSADYYDLSGLVMVVIPPSVTHTSSSYNVPVLAIMPLDPETHAKRSKHGATQQYPKSVNDPIPNENAIISQRYSRKPRDSLQEKTL